MPTVLVVIGILVFLIIVHEVGHFIVAKLFRVKVEEFGIGYPPRAFSFGTWGGTEYTLNWIPFGGFVRLFGDEGQSVKGRGSFSQSPRLVQLAIVAAGVAMNALAAYALFAIALHIGVPRQVAVPEPGQTSELIIMAVIPSSPAEIAGLKAGDKIVSISDDGGETPSDLTPAAVTDFVQAHGGKAVIVRYERGTRSSEAIVTPAHAIIPEAVERPALGIQLALVSTHPLPWDAALSGAVGATESAFTRSIQGVVQIAQELLRGGRPLEHIVGPVGIVSFMSDAAHNGFGAVLALAGLISVNLTIINLLPIPALDGGRIVLILAETVSRRSAPRLVVQMLNAFGIALIIFLMVTVTYHDIGRLLE